MINTLSLRIAARVLHQGGVVAYPTEGVYGLGCLPEHAEAVARLLALKDRNPRRGLILIAADLAQLEPFIRPLDGAMRERVLRVWPGPVTWIVPAREETPTWLTGGRDTLAVRVTAHQTARALCLAAESALVSTSANRSGRPPARTALATRRLFGLDIDYIVPGQVGSLEGPTEIRDARDSLIIRPTP